MLAAVLWNPSGNAAFVNFVQLNTIKLNPVQWDQKVVFVMGWVNTLGYLVGCWFGYSWVWVWVVYFNPRQTNTQPQIDIEK